MIIMPTSSSCQLFSPRPCEVQRAQQTTMTKQRATEFNYKIISHDHMIKTLFSPLAARQIPPSSTSFHFSFFGNPDSRYSSRGRLPLPFSRQKERIGICIGADNRCAVCQEHISTGYSIHMICLSTSESSTYQGTLGDVSSSSDCAHSNPFCHGNPSEGTLFKAK